MATSLKNHRFLLYFIARINSPTKVKQMKHRILSWAKYFCLLIIAVFITECSRNPVTGKKEFMLLSKEQEKALGLESDPGIIAQYGLYDDQQLQNFINDKGRQMGAISHRPDLDYQFRILDSPVVNAFAVPGGFIYFTRGIMAHFNNEAEFAGVLGHEIGHVTARHSASQYSKQVLAQVGLIAGVVAFPEFAQYADVAQQGVGLLFLKFGRDDESQSDKLGVAYSTQIGYDAKEMAGFFNTLKRMRDQGGQAIPTFLSTHPDPADRYNKVFREARRVQANTGAKNLKVNRNSYLRMIDGLVYGEDPRQGYVENNTFYHPDLKFEFNIPSQWQTINTPAQVQMAPEDGRAVMIMAIAQGSNLNQAEAGVLEKYQMQKISSRKTSINGLPTMITTMEPAPQQQAQQQQQQQTQQIRVLSYLIEYNGLIYNFLGVAEAKDFNYFTNVFEGTMASFKRLTDQSKINVKPERIKVESITKNGTLEQSLRSFGISTNRLEELAILNGMELKDPVTRGMLIKTIVK